MKPHGAPSCTVCCLRRTSLWLSRWILGGSQSQKYHYHLDLTNAVPIWAKPPCLRPEEKAWLDVHLNKLVAKGVIGPIFSRGAATMCYAIALSPGCLVQAALLSVPEYCPGQQTDDRVPVPTSMIQGGTGHNLGRQSGLVGWT